MFLFTTTYTWGEENEYTFETFREGTRVSSVTDRAGFEAAVREFSCYHFFGEHNAENDPMNTLDPEKRKLARDAFYLCARGAKYIVSTVNFQARWDADARRRLWKAYERLADWYLDSCRREEKVYFAAFDKRIATRIWPGRGASCRLGRRQISVAPDGTYYPCVQFVGRAGYEIGHVGAGLDERSRECIFARNESAKPACAGCALEGRCNNRCGCLNISTTGSLDAVPPFFCEHERHVIPLADRLAERLYAERNALFIQRHYNPAFPVASILEDMA